MQKDDDSSRFSGSEDDDKTNNDRKVSSRKRNTMSTRDDQQHGTIMLLTYNSDRTAQCMVTAFAFSLQFHTFTTENLRVFSEEYSTMAVIGIPPDFRDRIQTLPHLDAAMEATAIKLWIGGYKTCNKIDPA